MASSDDKFVFNGIDGSTGSYLTRPMTIDELAKLARGSWVHPGQETQKWLNDEKNYLEARHEAGIFDVVSDVDPGDLSQAGWGVIFSHDADPAVMEALRPLIEFRKNAAGENRFRLLSGEDGYRPGDTNITFLTRHGAKTFGKVDPDQMPYYLMIVGGPEQIPFSFQYSLDVNHAVGRLSFDRVEDYANYAASVIRAETEGVSRSKKAGFFGVRNEDDRATEMSSDFLMTPLVDKIRKRSSITDHWELESWIAEKATKGKLLDQISQSGGPAFLMTASHGLGFRLGDPNQERHQGAILCQDWPGPMEWRSKGPIPQDHFLSAEDIGSDADVHGLISFHFACYGGGTPEFEDYDVKENQPRGRIAQRPFIGALPKRLLSHPRGSALACIGHIERAWSFSFVSRKVQSTAEFWDALFNLLTQYPVGHAMDAFHTKFAEVSAGITDKLDADRGKPADKKLKPEEFVWDWVERNDARNYVLLGDPFVRLVPEKLGRPARKEKPMPHTVASPPANRKESEALPAGSDPSAESEKNTTKGKGKGKGKATGKAKEKKSDGSGISHDADSKAFEAPSGYRDITNHYYVDPAGKRELTLTPGGDRVDESQAFQAAWSHLSSASSLLGAEDLRMGAAEVLDDGRLLLTASYVVGTAVERRRQHFGLVRFADGRCLQVQLSAEVEDDEAAGMMRSVLLQAGASKEVEGVNFSATPATSEPGVRVESVGAFSLPVPAAFEFGGTHRFLSADGRKSFEIEFRAEGPEESSTGPESFGTQPELPVRGQFGRVEKVRRTFRDPIRYEAPNYARVGDEPGAEAFAAPGGHDVVSETETGETIALREKRVKIGTRSAIVRFSGEASDAESAEAELETFLKTIR